jgi:hypothetical protein
MSWSQYIGRPWRAEADGPDAYDCKGLVRAVQRASWGREVPALLYPQVLDFAQLRDACGRQGWGLVQDKPREADIIEVKGKQGPHVGVFVISRGRLKVLHAVQNLGVRINTMDELLTSYTRPRLWRHQ